MAIKTDQDSIANLGAQDPERKNSPVAWESDEDSEALRQEIPEIPVCHFNDESFSHGTVIKSGTVLLRCDHGIWIQARQSDPTDV
jgi:hypothetical protein